MSPTTFLCPFHHSNPQRMALENKMNIHEAKRNNNNLTSHWEEGDWTAAVASSLVAMQRP